MKILAVVQQSTTSKETDLAAIKRRQLRRRMEIPSRKAKRKRDGMAIANARGKLVPTNNQIAKIRTKPNSGHGVVIVKPTAEEQCGLF